MLHIMHSVETPSGTQILVSALAKSKQGVVAADVHTQRVIDHRHFPFFVRSSFSSTDRKPVCGSDGRTADYFLIARSP